MRSTITDKGREILARLELGEISMTFSGVRTGNGIYDSTEMITSRVALKNEKNAYSISSSTRDANGLLLTFIISNVDSEGSGIVSESYNVNEIGVFVNVEGDEYLYAIAVADADSGNKLPAFDGSNPIDFVQKFAFTLSPNANVTVDLTGAVALAADLEAHRTTMVYSEDGAHGIRYYNNSIQAYVDGEWIDAGGNDTLATEQEVKELAEQLMSGEDLPGGEGATDEEVEDAIEQLDDL